MQGAGVWCGVVWCGVVWGCGGGVVAVAVSADCWMFVRCKMSVCAALESPAHCPHLLQSAPPNPLSVVSNQYVRLSLLLSLFLSLSLSLNLL